MKYKKISNDILEMEETVKTQINIPDLKDQRRFHREMLQEIDEILEEAKNNGINTDD